MKKQICCFLYVLTSFSCRSEEEIIRKQPLEGLYVLECEGFPHKAYLNNQYQPVVTAEQPIIIDETISYPTCDENNPDKFEFKTMTITGIQVRILDMFKFSSAEDVKTFVEGEQRKINEMKKQTYAF